MRDEASGDGLFVVTEGSGPTLLLMHGGMGLDHTLFRPWLDPLTARFRLVYYDHRGNGRSPRPESFEGISHASWAADADALRAALGVDRVVVFGHSYGGFLALEYALRSPDRVDALILSNTTPAMDYPAVVVENARRRGTPAQVQRVMELFTAPVADDASFAREFRELLPLYFHRYDAGIADALLARLRPSAAAFNHANEHCLPSYGLVDRLGEIRAPTLVLSGRHDWSMPPEHAGERLAAGIDGAEHVIFEESGHFPFVEERDRYIAVVEGWLSRRATGAPEPATPV